MKLLALIITLSPLQAIAQTNQCAAINEDLDRLACYDREAGRTPVITEIPTQSAWSTRIETSAMTDQTNVYMTVISDEAVQCSYSKEHVSLIVRCRENTTSVIFATGCHMTSSRYNDYGDVTYRLDDASARTRGFVESTNNRSLGLWSGGKAIPFAKAMFATTQLIARMTPYGASPFTATFNISGLEDDIGPLREACHW